MRITISYGDVDNANYMLLAQFFAQLDYACSVCCIYIDSHVQRFVEFHSGRDMKHYIHILYQHNCLLGRDLNLAGPRHRVLDESCSKPKNALL